MELDLYKTKILEELGTYGIYLKEGKLHIPDIRHTQKLLSNNTNSKYNVYRNKVRKYFASSLSEIDVDNIKPKLILVENKKQKDIFNYSKSFWSVPVSGGFGRRLNYILFDEGNKKVIGIFGLCDPVINLKVRDDYIGWNREQKAERLYNLFTAYILGAVPPYNKILGSKLVALSSITKQVVNDFYNKYKGKKTIISNKEKPPYLVGIDTMGAFGKSAIYTRLKGWKFLGYTKGESHIHLTSNGVYDVLLEVIKKYGNASVLSTNRYGQGSNYKLRVVSEGLKILGLSKLKTHNIKRSYYLSPLITNFKEFLTMKTDEVNYNVNLLEDNFDYWYNRWFKDRKEKLLREV